MLGLAAAWSPSSDYRLDFQAPSVVEGEPGTTVQFTAIAQLTEAVDKVQSWALGIASDEPTDCPIVDATVQGTVGADVSDNPPGLRNNGFELTQLTSGPGNEGVISAVILSLSLPITLDPNETPHALLRVTLETTAPPAGQDETYKIEFIDGLQGPGPPTDNIVVVGGLSIHPTLGSASVLVRGVYPDADGDGVPDGYDICPDTPVCATTVISATGCAVDSDDDGVADGCDDCPGTAPGDLVDSDGCSTADDDGDGVLNDDDLCANTPTCATNVDANGCAIDSDGDGNVDGCEPPAQTCCGGAGPVAPLGLAIGMLLLSRFTGYRGARRHW
jgi:hypothetical protein